MGHILIEILIIINRPQFCINKTSLSWNRVTLHTIQMKELHMKYWYHIPSPWELLIFKVCKLSHLPVPKSPPQNKRNLGISECLTLNHLALSLMIYCRLIPPSVPHPFFSNIHTISAFNEQPLIKYCACTNH